MAHDPGTLLATTHELGTGESVRLRLTRPSDAPLVRAFLDGLSPATRERRFFTAAPGPAIERHFTFYDPRERVVVAATLPVDGYECIVGIADMVLLETGLAELGVVVDDDRQGQGIGTLLSEAAAWTAAQRGATHAKAQMVGPNSAMERVMERLGPTVHGVEDGHPVIYARLDGLRSRARAA